MTNKVLLGLIMAVAIGIVVVGSADKARQQPAAAITAVSKTDATIKVDTSEEAREIVSSASDSADLSVFVALAQSIDLASLLQERGGVYTVFAPTNAAFERAYGPGGERTVIAAESRNSLSALLKYHVVAGRYDMSSLESGTMLTTLEGEQLTVIRQKNDIYINGVAMVVSASETTGNSTVYAIDTVLSPEKAVEKDEDSTPIATVESTGKVRYRRLCTDNGDGTVTIQDQVQSQFLGFLWWGAWHDVGEQLTGPSATGCSPFQGFNGTVRTKAEMSESIATEEKDQSSETGKRVPRYRSVCTDNGNGTVTIQNQVQNPIWPFFWGAWHDDGTLPIIQKGTCGDGGGSMEV